VGVEIWRIVKFKVEAWEKNQYGEFYSGDSYIILNTYKDKEEIKYDVHFWIGKYSTQDEYGTAAYKTVELDTFLEDKPVQHREVQGHESALFKKYFDTITHLKGGRTLASDESSQMPTSRACSTSRNRKIRQSQMYRFL